jgi:murein DD-endopeptidase / murein LD-carboxypeptidase
VGVAATAARAAGLGVVAPAGYALRLADSDRVASMIAAAGGARVDAVAAGRILLMRVAATQLHLGVATTTGIVHADAHLRRVVERPGAPPWPVIAVFSFEQGTDAWRH